VKGGADSKPARGGPGNRPQRASLTKRSAAAGRIFFGRWQTWNAASGAAKGMDVLRLGPGLRFGSLRDHSVSLATRPAAVRGSQAWVHWGHGQTRCRTYGVRCTKGREKDREAGATLQT